MIRSLRFRVLAGAAVAALLAGTAHGQGLQGPISIDADTLTREPNGRIEATGNVEAASPEQSIRAESLVREPNGDIRASGQVETVTEGRALSADQISYDNENAVISASGNVRLYQPDGSVQFADTLTFTDDLTTGVATGFATRAEDNVTLAASSIIARDETYTELNRAIFTACPLCDDNGQEKTPTWSVSAEKVVRDLETNSVNYRNAVIHIGGAPVLYLPFFSHADWAVDRKSGLLSPSIQHTDRRGLSYDQPVLWAISPYQDLVFRPQINTKVRPVLNFDWRRRFYSGLLQVRGGYTYEQDFNSSGVQFGPARTKAYILADGAFEISPSWSWGFTANRARDRRLFDQYSIEYDLAQPGLFLADDRRLISQIYAVRQTNSSYFSIAALAFQSLRPVPGPPGPFGVGPLEDDKTLPLIGPLVEFRYTPPDLVAGGRLRVGASGVVLRRDLSATVPGAPGTDSSRATVQADWRRTFILPNGLRVEPFGLARGDVYATADLSPTDSGSHQTSRAIATAGVDMSLPLVRVDGRVTTTIEPVLQVAISPDSKASPLIPNEDSLAIQFDETNFFETNRFPGFDLYEGGQRANLGLRASIDWGEGRNARLMVGQTFRAEPDPAFLPRTGLTGTTSDWIAAVEITPLAGLSMFARSRFDDLDLRRLEAGFDADLERGAGYLRYMRTDADYTGQPREDIEGAGELFLSENWGVVAGATRDLERHQWLRRSAGVVYEDDCLRFELLYQRDNNPVLGAGESSSIVVRLTLATLGGDSGASPYGRRR